MRNRNRSDRRLPWTQEELDILRFFWTHKPPESIAGMIDRNPRAVQKKGEELGLNRMARKAYMSMKQLEERSGYERGQIKKAAQKLGMRLRRLKTTRGTAWHAKDLRAAPEAMYWILPEEMEMIVGELQRRSLGERYYPELPDNCHECGTDYAEQPYKARGLCRRCYNRAQKNGTLKKYPKILRKERRGNGK
jgi:hypothetical protein